MYAPKLTVGYQIPGFIDYQHGCNSADKTGSTTEVGTVISQGIRYDNLRAWYNNYTVWTGKSDKSGKPAQNANHYNYGSYESASDANSRNSMWGYQGSEEIAIPIYKKARLTVFHGDQTVVVNDIGVKKSLITMTTNIKEPIQTVMLVLPRKTSAKPKRNLPFTLHITSIPLFIAISNPPKAASVSSAPELALVPIMASPRVSTNWFPKLLTLPIPVKTKPSKSTK